MKKLVNYTARGWWETGVIRAVDEFVKSNPVELVEIRNEQFVLRKCGEKRRRS